MTASPDLESIVLAENGKLNMALQYADHLASLRQEKREQISKLNFELRKLHSDHSQALTIVSQRRANYVLAKDVYNQFMRLRLFKDRHISDEWLVDAMQRLSIQPKSD